MKTNAEAQQKREAEAATKRKAEADAKQKADDDAANKRRAEEQDQKIAEATETALRLGLVDRQHLQVALTYLGFDTQGVDGAFGPRTRQMIAAWQQKNSVPATGFMSAAQRDQLFQSAMAAITRWEEDQKKAEEQKKVEEMRGKTNDEAKIKPTPTPVPQPTTAEMRHITIVAKAERTSQCGGQNVMQYPANILADEIQVGFSGGYQTFLVDPTGKFGKPIVTANGNRLLIEGNVKTGQFSIYNANNPLCTWKGSF